MGHDYDLLMTNTIIGVCPLDLQNKIILKKQYYI